MATEHFCLRWNNHQSTLVSVFDNLLESGTLVDCTLAADGRYLKAHKVVLSACSPYLGMLLSQHYDKHPIIILKDVKFDELKAMLDYMYRGEVNISQEQLSTFLKAAETLQIKGLTDAGSDEGNGLQPNRPPSSNSTTSANEDPQSPGPPGEGGSSPGPRKRKRNKHGDDGEGDSVSKISLSEGSDRLSGTSVGSPSGKSASVKREPGDGEGEGQMSVDDSGEVVMMSRPGPSNGGTNNKAPWILSADSSGEEMQLTPGQDNRPRGSSLQDNGREEAEQHTVGGQHFNEEIKTEIKQEVDPFAEQNAEWRDNNWSDSETRNSEMMIMPENESELIIPEPLEGQTLSSRDYQVLQDQSDRDYQVLQDQSGRDYQVLQDQSDRDYQVLQDQSGRDYQVLQDQSGRDYQVLRDQSGRDYQVLQDQSGRDYQVLRDQSGRDYQVLQDHFQSNIETNLASFPREEWEAGETNVESQTLVRNNCENQPGNDEHFTSQCSSFTSQRSQGSKIVLDVDAVGRSKVKVTKPELNLRSKYRKILPAPSSSGSSNKSNVVQTLSTNIERQSTTQRQSSPQNVPAGKISLTHVQQNDTSSHQPVGRLVTNASSTSTSQPAPPLISIHQTIPVGQIRQSNTSVLPIPHQFQGSKMIDSSNNVLSIPQQVHSGQINNSSATVLSIAPQFSLSQLQPGNIQVQFSNKTNLQTGNFQNTQFFSNTNLPQNQPTSSQNNVVPQQAQAISHPVFVTSNIVNSSQFLPPTSVVTPSFHSRPLSTASVSTTSAPSVVRTLEGHKRVIYVRPHVRSPRGTLQGIRGSRPRLGRPSGGRRRGRGRLPSPQSLSSTVPRMILPKE